MAAKVHYILRSSLKDGKQIIINRSDEVVGVCKAVKVPADTMPQGKGDRLCPTVEQSPASHSRVRVGQVV